MTSGPDDTTAAADEDSAGIGPATLPEAAERRLGLRSFTSGLSVNDFAACLHMGLRPIALVQGFCAMRWVWRNYGGGYNRYGVFALSGYRTSTVTTYHCPHYGSLMTSSDHRTWGANEEVVTMESSWESGWGTALTRMLAEARELGAHGVIGVLDTSHNLIDAGIREFHLTGTAVVVDGQEPSGEVWSTFLAGQRLAKLLEAGFLPVSVVGAAGAVAILPYCVTEIRERGGYDPSGVVAPEGEVAQVSDAHMAVRRVARDRIRRHLGNDTLHGADLRTDRDWVSGYKTLVSVLRGTRVRHFRAVAPLASPVPTVRLG
jgi:hypothetical protein